MKRFIIVAVCASLPIAAAVAQQAPDDWKPPAKRISPTQGLVAQMSPNGDTPKMADGHPDLTGFWGGGNVNAPYAAFGSRGLQYFEPDQAAMQRGNNWSRPV